MTEKINFTVKKTDLTEIQLKRLRKLLEPMHIETSISEGTGFCELTLVWDPSEVYRKSSRYAGRNRIEKYIDWDYIDYLRSIKTPPRQIAIEAGLSLRTYYRRLKEHLEETQQ